MNPVLVEEIETDGEREDDEYRNQKTFHLDGLNPADSGAEDPPFQFFRFS